MSILFVLPNDESHVAMMDVPPRIGEHVRIGLMAAVPDDTTVYRVKSVEWQFHPEANVVTDAEVELELAP